MKNVLTWCKIERILRIIYFNAGLVSAILVFPLIFFYKIKWLLWAFCINGIICLLTDLCSRISRRVIKNKFDKHVRYYLRSRSEPVMLIKIRSEYDSATESLEYTLYFDGEVSEKAWKYIKSIENEMENVFRQPFNVWPVINYDCY